MKIAVVGSREFLRTFDENNKEWFIDTTKEFFVEDILGSEFNPSDILISGGARGIDQFAESCIEKINHDYIQSGHIKKHIFLPDWNKYGKRAGFLRNELIINEADRVIAFWDGKSKGTKHSINLAIKANKPLDIYVR